MVYSSKSAQIIVEYKGLLSISDLNFGRSQGKGIYGSEI